MFTSSSGIENWTIYYWFLIISQVNLTYYINKCYVFILLEFVYEVCGFVYIFLDASYLFFNGLNKSSVLSLNIIVTNRVQNASILFCVWHNHRIESQLMTTQPQNRNTTLTSQKNNNFSEIDTFVINLRFNERKCILLVFSLILSQFIYQITFLKFKYSYGR